jgi:DNA-binding CsgD family transcriptional regulator
MGLEPDTTVDFGKLNAAERTALRLLAKGHTAKSIANLTDRSVGAVNERLREARRKTGVGSSRELARLFAAQENRDELIGMVPAPAADPESLSPTAPRSRSWKGVIVMSVVLSGVLAAIVLVAQPQNQARPATPDADAALLSDAPTPRQLHDRIAAEPRDPIWAPRIESELMQWFASRPEIADVAGPVTVRCGNTMCEAFGHYSTDAPADRKNAAMSAIQGAPFKGAISPLGLKSDDASFAGDSFAVFVSRVPAGS